MKATKKPLKRAIKTSEIKKKTIAKKKVLARSKSKTLSQKASAARDIGAGLIAKATDTIKKMVKKETPNPSTGANIDKPMDLAHSPGHRRLNVKNASEKIPAPKLQKTPKHIPLKIPGH